jgi:exo-poly-alpha-galacturonosidase
MIGVNRTDVPQLLRRGLAATAVAVLTLVAVPTAAGAHLSRPAPPLDVRVPALAFDEQSITLAWEKPARHADIVDYRVYLDGRLLGISSAGSGSPAKPYIDAFYADPANDRQVRVVMNTFTATGLRPDRRYHFTVRSVDAAGRESPDSNRVTQATTPVPQVFDVEDFGAVGDAATLDTAAIQAAIDACSPGGKVLVPAGVFRTGAIWLKSDMTLEVAEGATLLGSENADDYPWNYRLYDYSTDIRFYSLINAHTYDYGSLRNIRIVGEGTIDGNGWQRNGVDAEGFPVSAPSSSSTVATNGILAASQVARAAQLGSPAPYPTRSNLITLRGVENVYYGGFTAVNPSNHTLVNVRDRNVTVNGVKLETFNVNNADGIEFTNSDGLTVINNVFDTGDDDMNFAAGLGAAAADDPPSQHAWISNNYFRKGHGAVVEGSHTGAWIEHIVAEDNVINGTDVGLRMKTDPNNGGGSRHVTFRDNAMKNIGQQAFIFTSAYSDPNAAVVVEPAPTKAQFRDVHVETSRSTAPAGSR